MRCTGEESSAACRQTVCLNADRSGQNDYDPHYQDYMNMFLDPHADLTAFFLQLHSLKMVLRPILHHSSWHEVSPPSSNFACATIPRMEYADTSAGESPIATRRDHIPDPDSSTVRLARTKPDRDKVWGGLA